MFAALMLFFFNIAWADAPDADVANPVKENRQEELLLADCKCNETLRVKS